MNVPLLDLNQQYDEIGDELNDAVLSVLRSQQFILGPAVKGLESTFAPFCGTAHAVGCGSGSDALLLALMALGVGAGDEVITSSFTFFATAGMIVRAGATPVFVDIDPATFNIDTSLIAKAVTPRTKAIIPVHLFGQCAPMDQITEIGASSHLAVIEDAAQAIGAELDGRRAGSLGDVAAFSFYPTKNLGGAGDGGMLTTSDERLAARLRSLRTHGAEQKYYHDEVGINSRLDSIQAAILSVKFRYIDKWNQARRSNASRYRPLFEASGLIDSERVSLPIEVPGATHVYNQFVIRAQNRDELRGFLRENGVGTEVYYPVPLHMQRCFSDLGYKTGDLPVSEAAASQVLALPIYPELNEESQQYVVDQIAAFYRR